MVGVMSLGISMLAFSCGFDMLVAFGCFVDSLIGVMSEKKASWSVCVTGFLRNAFCVSGIVPVSLYFPVSLICLVGAHQE